MKINPIGTGSGTTSVDLNRFLFMYFGGIYDFFFEVYLYFYQIFGRAISNCKIQLIKIILSELLYVPKYCSVVDFSHIYEGLNNCTKSHGTNTAIPFLYHLLMSI